MFRDAVLEAFSRLWFRKAAIATLAAELSDVTPIGIVRIDVMANTQPLVRLICSISESLSAANSGVWML